MVFFVQEHSPFLIRLASLACQKNFCHGNESCELEFQHRHAKVKTIIHWDIPIFYSPIFYHLPDTYSWNLYDDSLKSMKFFIQVLLPMDDCFFAFDIFKALQFLHLQFLLLLISLSEPFRSQISQSFMFFKARNHWL